MQKAVCALQPDDGELKKDFVYHVIIFMIFDKILLASFLLSACISVGNQQYQQAIKNIDVGMTFSSFHAIDYVMFTNISNLPICDVYTWSIPEKIQIEGLMIYSYSQLRFSEKNPWNFQICHFTFNQKFLREQAFSPLNSAKLNCVTYLGNSKFKNHDPGHGNSMWVFREHPWKRF